MTLLRSHSLRRPSRDPSVWVALGLWLSTPPPPQSQSWEEHSQPSQRQSLPAEGIWQNEQGSPHCLCFSVARKAQRTDGQTTDWLAFPPCSPDCGLLGVSTFSGAGFL